MKEVQQALALTGIPAYALAWRVTAQYPVPPPAYLVYTTHTYESEHWDDRPIRYTVLVYLNLWTKDDPTENIRIVRAAMRNAGFGLSDESISYDAETGQTLVAWTWQIQMETEVTDSGT